MNRKYMTIPEKIKRKKELLRHAEGIMDELTHNEVLKGLARQCPKCNIIFHAEVKGRKPVDIESPVCYHEFTVQKYKRGERPKCERL